jgi:lactoylglutathione lyase
VKRVDSDHGDATVEDRASDSIPSSVPTNTGGFDRAMSAFALSKPFVDVGLFTNCGEEMRDFYGEIMGLDPLDTITIEPGYLLHRYDAHGSALKLNVLDAPIPDRSTCYARLLWPDPACRRIERITDPDGNEVERVPPGHLDVDQIGIVYRVTSLAMASAFAGGALGAIQLAADRFRMGRSVLIFEVDPSAPRTGALESLGFTYTTLHVTDTVSVHAHLVAHGCSEAIPPTPFEAITTYSFVRDPTGNWIEISQRNDLTGPTATPLPAGSGLSHEQIQAIRRRP